eukprot:scaffold521302_cov41-Prasinocladus_malaysianus.AAC.1
MKGAACSKEESGIDSSSSLPMACLWNCSRQGLVFVQDLVYDIVSIAVNPILQFYDFIPAN